MFFEWADSSSGFPASASSPSVAMNGTNEAKSALAIVSVYAARTMVLSLTA